MRTVERGEMKKVVREVGAVGVPVSCSLAGFSATQYVKNGRVIAQAVYMNGKTKYQIA